MILPLTYFKYFIIQLVYFITLYNTTLSLFFVYFLSHSLYWEVIERRNYFYIEHCKLIYPHYLKYFLANNISSEIKKLLFFK